MRLKAWQPFTPSGVGEFALSAQGRLFTVESIVALLAAACVVWFLEVAWFPVAINAMRALPAEGAIERGRLETTRTTPDPLAGNTFLAVAVDLGRRSSPDVSPDFYVTFHRTDLEICSFLGCVVIPYPPNRAFYFNGPDLEARWGAWRPFILGGVMLAISLGLVLSWSLLAAVYAPLVRLLGFFRDKQAPLGACWKLASAAMLPGACLVLISIMLYGLEMISLVQFCILYLLHFLVGWIYLYLAPKTLPALDEALPENPFK